MHQQISKPGAVTGHPPALMLTMFFFETWTISKNKEGIMKFYRNPKKRCDDICDFLIKSGSAYKELNIKTLAAKYGLHRSYLVRTFKEYTGKDLHAYMNRLKMLKASVLLICKPNLRIWQIEEYLGWRTGSFSISFKKFFGVNPGYFRKHFKF